MIISILTEVISPCFVQKLFSSNFCTIFGHDVREVNHQQNIEGRIMIWCVILKLGA